MNDATAPYLVLRMSGTEGASLDSVRLEFKNKEDATIGVFWFSENAEGSLRGIDGNLLPALSTTAKEYVIDLGKSGISTDIGAFHVHSGGNAVGGQITLEQVSYATVETVDYAEIMKALPVYQVPDTEKPVLTVNVPATAVVGDSIEIAVKATDDSGNVVTKISVVKDGKDVSLKDNSFVAEAGVYTVTVTAVDAEENEATEVRQITVAEETAEPGVPAGADNNGNNMTGIVVAVILVIVLAAVAVPVVKKKKVK